MRSAAAAQRRTIFPSRQRQTFRVRKRTPLCGLSITLVETRQRARLGDKPKRFTVNISPNPSRKLAAALGYSRSSHSACFSIRAIPSGEGRRKSLPKLSGQRPRRQLPPTNGAVLCVLLHVGAVPSRRPAPCGSSSDTGGYLLFESATREVSFEWTAGPIVVPKRRSTK